MTVDERTVTDLETTALDAQERIAVALTWAPNRPEKDKGSFGDGISALDELVAAVRELARRAAEAQTLRDALEQARWAINLGVGCARDLGDDSRLSSLLDAHSAARAALATPDTPPDAPTEGGDET
jgi:hypothetical protein